MFTHRNSEALGGGEFFGRVAFRIIHKNLKPRQARHLVKHTSNMTADVHQLLDAELSVRLSSRSLQTWVAGSSRRSHGRAFRNVRTCLDKS